MKINFNISTFLLGVITTFLFIIGVFIFQLTIKFDRLEAQLNTQSNNLTELKSMSFFQQDRRKITGKSTTSDIISSIIPDEIVDNTPKIIKVNSEAWAQLRRGMSDREVEKLIGPNFVMRSDVKSNSYKYTYGDQVGYVYFNRRMKVINWDLPAYVSEENKSPD